MQLAPEPLGERGSSPVEEVLVLPALMLMLVAVFQIALYGLALHAGQFAVDEGGAVVRSSGGSTLAARRTVRSDLARLGGGLVTDPRITVATRASGYVEVSLSGRAPALFPGVHLTINVVNDGPPQVFRASG